MELKAPGGPLEAQAPDIGRGGLAEGGAEAAMEGVDGEAGDAGQGFGREGAVEVGVDVEGGVGKALALRLDHVAVAGPMPGAVLARLMPSAVPPSFSAAPARK